jgi:hypothetical protein
MGAASQVASVFSVTFNAEGNGAGATSVLVSVLVSTLASVFGTTIAVTVPVAVFGTGGRLSAIVTDAYAKAARVAAIIRKLFIWLLLKVVGFRDVADAPTEWIGWYPG